MPSGVYKHRPNQGFQKGHLKLRYEYKKGNHHSEEHKQKISLSAIKAGVGKWMVGRTPSFITQGKHYVKKGSDSPLWKGGLTPLNSRIRGSLEYRNWRKAVFLRDNWTCVWCGAKGVTLNADHIKPFAYFPELRFDIDNGRTLCVDCHKKTDTYKKK